MAWPGNNVSRLNMVTNPDKLKLKQMLKGQFKMAESFEQRVQ